MDNRIKANAPAPMDPEIQKAVLSQLLSSSDQDAILSLETARELYRKALEQKALEKYKFPKRPSSDGFFHYNLKDPTKKSGYRQVKSKPLEGLRPWKGCARRSLRMSMVSSERPGRPSEKPTRSYSRGPETW